MNRRVTGMSQALLEAPANIDAALSETICTLQAVFRPCFSSEPERSPGQATATATRVAKNSTSLTSVHVVEQEHGSDTHTRTHERTNERMNARTHERTQARTPLMLLDLLAAGQLWPAGRA